MSDVLRMYDGAGEYTWARPSTDARLEGKLMTRVISEASFPGGRVADIGGGNGYYSSRLLQQDRRVDLFDLSPLMVAEAEQRISLDQTVAGFRAVVADARDLPAGDDVYDTCLLLGPYYCLHDEADRVRVLTEAKRVTKPGGKVVVQVLTWTAALRSLMTHWPELITELDSDALLTSGRVVMGAGERTGEVPLFLRVHYWASPESVEGEVVSAGLQIDEVRAIDCPDPDAGQAALGDVSEASIEAWAELVWSVGARKDLLLAGDTLLVTLRVPST